MENDNKCMACECPCEMHKEHTHDEAAPNAEPTGDNKCMACECPCEEHKVHNHE